MSIDLFKHNQTAYKAAVAMLAEICKAAVIHPTGTGKSFIGFKLCEYNPDKTVCWLSPSEYIFRTQLENLKKTGAEIPQNIKFFTYAKLTYMCDEELSEIVPDFFVIDEIHRMGAPKWNKRVTALLSMYPDVPMLGMSATNIRYLDNQRDIAEVLFDKLNKNFITGWDELYRCAFECYSEYGNLEVPRRYKTANGLSLGNRLDTQRDVRSGKVNGILTEERRKKLDSIDMIWSAPAEKQWERRFKHLVEYKEKFGNVKPTFTYKSDYIYSLGRWFYERKKKFADGKLNERQIGKLSEMGVEL